MKRAFILFLAAIMLLTCLAGCGGNTATEAGGGSSTSSAIELALDTFPPTLHPHEFTSINEYSVVFNIYEPLVYVMDDGSEQFLMAESYEVSEDGRVYTFQLRSGVKFHNGEVMTADDVVFSLESAVADPYMATYVSAIAGVEKVDDTHVAITLSAPSAAFMRNQKYITILNEKFCAENASLANCACGTGPYMLHDYSDGVSITLSAFSDYWQGAASIGTVTYNYIGDTATKTMSFESGDLTFINVPASDWDRISANSDYRSGSTTQDLVQWLVLNSEAAPLDDVRVRQAVYRAINKEDVLAIAANGAGTVANVMADPRIIAGATDDFPYLTFDQEKARSLLAEAGYPDGVDIGEITYVGGTSWEKIAAAVQSNLADVGITVTMKSMDASAIFSSLASGDFTVGVLGSGLGRDYSLYSQLYTMDYLDVLDMCRLQDPEVDSKFAEAAITVDKTAREAIYKDLIQQLETGAYYIPVFYEDFIWASDPGFTPFIDDGALMIYRCTME